MADTDRLFRGERNGYSEPNIIYPNTTRAVACSTYRNGLLIPLQFSESSID